MAPEVRNVNKRIFSGLAPYLFSYLAMLPRILTCPLVLPQKRITSNPTPAWRWVLETPSSQLNSKWFVYLLSILEVVELGLWFLDLSTFGFKHVLIWKKISCLTEVLKHCIQLLDHRPGLRHHKYIKLDLFLIVQVFGISCES